MNNLLAQTYTVELTIKVCYTLRAESIEQAREWAQDVMFNERDHLHVMIDNSDVDWYHVKEIKALELKRE